MDKRRLRSIAHQNRLIANASELCIGGAKSRSKSQIANDFPSHPGIATQHCFVLSEMTSNFWGPRWASPSQKSQKLLRFRCAKPKDTVPFPLFAAIWGWVGSKPSHGLFLAHFSNFSPTIGNLDPLGPGAETKTWCASVFCTVEHFGTKGPVLRLWLGGFSTTLHYLSRCFWGFEDYLCCILLGSAKKRGYRKIWRGAGGYRATRRGGASHETVAPYRGTAS